MKLTIFQRLTAGYLSIMVLVLSFGGYISVQLNRLSRITHQAAGVDSEIIRGAEKLAAELQIVVSLEKKFWISADKDFYSLFQKRGREFREGLEELNSFSPTPDFKPMLDQAIALSKTYLAEVKQRTSDPDAGSSPAYKVERDETIRRIDLALQQIAMAGNSARNTKIRTSGEISDRMVQVTIAFAVICIILSLAVSFITTRTIVRPIIVFQRKTRAIGSGQFVTIENLRAPPEILRLAGDFNTMSKRLKELDTLKEDFVSHVSHTLRTPLTAIREASELLLSGACDSDPEERFNLLTIVRNECRRLIVSVNRILDLSRMESNMMDYRWQPLDLNAVIQTTVRKLDLIARSRDIDLAFTPRSDLPPIHADAAQLDQLLENLIDNAIKFTGAGGAVTLDIRPPTDTDGTIIVGISDTGCGIEPEYLQSIFQRFHRIERGEETARGTGLGLTIAKHIVKAHGGELWVESEKGHGSTFYFSLLPA